MSTQMTSLLFCYRLPSLSAAEFQSYIEDKHVPLVKSLLGADYPLSHTRYYTDKDNGFAVGAPSAEDADLVAVIKYASFEAIKRSLALRGSDGIREIIEADEAKFMIREKVKVVVVGEERIRGS